MKISVVRPTAMITREDGSTTRRLSVGDQCEFSSDWEIRIAKKLVALGLAVEVGGNAEPTETKAPVKRTRKRATKAKSEE